MTYKKLSVPPLCRSSLPQTVNENRKGVSRDITEYPAYNEKYEIGVSQPSLPGHGEKGKECGEEGIGLICQSCGYSWIPNKSCMMRECPNCYQKWASKESRMASYRLWSGAKEVCRSPYRLVHCVVSMKSSGDIVKERSLARKVAKRHGIVGGCSIPHHLRQNEDGCFVNDGYVHHHGLGIAPGDISPGGISGDGDVVFKVILDARFGDYRGFRRMRDVKRCLRYLLTHCSVIQGRHTLTWWGCMSYNKLTTEQLNDAHPGVISELQKPKHRCPKCGSFDVVRIQHMDWVAGELIDVRVNIDGGGVT